MTSCSVSIGMIPFLSVARVLDGASSVLDEHHVARTVEASRDVAPVDDVPDGADVVGPPVLVLQVVRVLPRVDHEQRDAALAGVPLVVVDLLDVETFAERLP